MSPKSMLTEALPLLALAAGWPTDGAGGAVTAGAVGAAGAPDVAAAAGVGAGAATAGADQAAEPGTRTSRVKISAPNAAAISRVRLKVTTLLQGALTSYARRRAVRSRSCSSINFHAEPGRAFPP